MPLMPPQRPNAPYARPEGAAFLFDRAPISEEMEEMSPVEFARYLRRRAEELEALWDDGAPFLSEHE